MNKKHALYILGTLVLLGLSITVIDQQVLPKFTKVARETVQKEARTLFKKAISKEEITERIELIRSEINTLDPLLVVGNQNVDIYMQQKSKKELFGINLGDTICNLRASNNRIQYVANMRDIDVTITKENTIQVSLPRPYINEEMIAINPDYKLDCEIGWARHKNYSGEMLRNRLKQTMKKNIIEKATLESDGYLLVAETNFKNQIKLIFSKFFPLEDNVTMLFKFKEKEEQKKGTL